MAVEKEWTGTRVQIAYHDSEEDRNYSVSYSNVKETADPGDIFEVAEGIAAQCADSKEDVFVHESYMLLDLG